ncbi:hypothetical protein PTKIN_Ptkin06aG0107600 [Pterospermum kingtungense]
MADNGCQIGPFTWDAFLNLYVEVGEVEKDDSILHKAGYVARIRQFQSLVQAYINAKMLAYGMGDRLKADNVFPNKALAEQLDQVDAFRRTAAPIYLTKDLNSYFWYPFRVCLVWRNFILQA